MTTDPFDDLEHDPGCVWHDYDRERCLTDEDIDEERLKARDYDAWADL